MALFTVDVVSRNHNSNYSETLLLNTEKVGNFYYDSSANGGSGGTVFFFAENESRRTKSIRYETSLSHADFFDKFSQTVFRESDMSPYRRRLNLSVVARGINEEPWEKQVNVDAHKLIKAYDDGSYAIVEVDSGSFDKLVYKTLETISEIKSEYSTSVSAS